MKIQFESVHFSADQKLLNYIEKKIEKLSQFYDKIIDCTVILKLENSGQVKDKIVEVKLNVPGDIIFGEKTDKTFEGATDEVFGPLRRQLIKHKEKQRAY